MALDDGLRGEMPIPPSHPEFWANPPALDERTAERLLAGRLVLTEVPPDYARVAEVLAAAAAPPSSDELAGEHAAVAQFAAAAGPIPPRASRRRGSGHTRLVGAKLAAAAVVVVLSLAGVAGAVSGTLPDPAQRVAHRVLGRAGVPGPDERRAPADGATSTSHRAQPTATTAAGASVTGPSKTSLCRAWRSGEGGADNQRSATFTALAAAAGGADRVDDYCGVSGSSGGGQAHGGGEGTTSTTGPEGGRSGGDHDQGSGQDGGNGNGKRQAKESARVAGGEGTGDVNGDSYGRGNDKSPRPTEPQDRNR
jgi:hypothetical protein